MQTTKIGSVAEPFCEAENGLLYCNMRLAATAQGHSRRSDGQQGFAECPLCLQWRPNLCVATNRRDGPKGDISTAAKQHRYSITSSARSRTELGKSIPIVFAVLRLRINSNLVGCSIGRSVVLVPRAILST